MLTAMAEPRPHRDMDQTTEVFPTLPGKMQRSQISDILREIVSPLWGMKSGRLMTLLTMIDQTRPQDWVTCSTEPVCYMQQTQLAIRLGKTERAIRNDEAEFVRLGLVEKRTAANGGRSRAGQLGLVFTPMITLVPRLKAILSELRADRKEKEGLVRHRSHLKRRAQEAIAELQALGIRKAETEDAYEAFSAWPSPESLRRMSIEAVIEHSETAKGLVDKLLTLLGNRYQTSGQPEPDFRYYIQDTTQEESMYCNAAQEIATGKKPDYHIMTDTPNGSSECLEEKHVGANEAYKNNFTDKLTPKRLYDLCAFDMKMHIDIATKGRATMLHHDFINAAYECAAAMGINHSAWTEAIEAMGEFSAALCIILIDANRDHPVTPIRSPGGTLRAMTRKHIAGKLNIIGGLIGLNVRSNTMKNT